MRLETDRLLIRRFTLHDTEELAKIYGDPSVMSFVGPPLSLEDVELKLRRTIARYEQSPAELCAIEHKASHRLLGHVGLVEWNLDGRHDYEVIYLLGREARGRGYATEAARGVCGHAFSHLPIARLLAIILSLNAASVKVAERLGMHLLTKRLMDQCHALIYGITRQEWLIEAPGPARDDSSAPSSGPPR